MHPSHLHYLPLPGLIYTFLLGALLGLFLLLQLGVLRHVYERIGLSSRAVIFVLLASLLGSYVNIPIFELPDARVVDNDMLDFFGFPFEMPVERNWPGTVVSINVGGALIPLALSIYLLARHDIWLSGAIATAIVAAVTHGLAKIVPGVGIAVPIFVPPIVSAIVALVISRDFAAPIAYIAGSLGTLIGADLLNIEKLPEIGTPMLSIGGAGTFDGIFVSGILAVLLASLRRAPSPA
ncbi:MAG: DUF1614 domain-containing protein [Methylocystis sp.]|nr:DUF1614 domain-containing protein [Methylocystis sp.]